MLSAFKLIIVVLCFTVPIHIQNSDPANIDAGTIPTNMLFDEGHSFNFQ